MTDKDYVHRGKIAQNLEKETKDDQIKRLEKQVVELKKRIAELEKV